MLNKKIAILKSRISCSLPYGCGQQSPEYLRKTRNEKHHLQRVWCQDVDNTHRTIEHTRTNVYDKPSSAACTGIGLVEICRVQLQLPNSAAFDSGCPDDLPTTHIRSCSVLNAFRFILETDGYIHRAPFLCLRLQFAAFALLRPLAGHFPS